MVAPRQRLSYFLAGRRSPERRRQLLDVYVDADGCPVKEEVYRVARRCALTVYIVSARHIAVPAEPWVRPVVVGGRFDAADDWIAERAGEDDVVVTGDIPLAARCLERGAYVLGPRGQEFTDETIGSALAGRELMDQLRQMGAASGGPPALTRQDRSRFLQRLDEIVQTVRRSRRT
jgi:uncharacterized protein YaiI (UPF0178 family)